MNSDYAFKVNWCPICSQGWVEIVKDISTNILFLKCEECEHEWNHPMKVINKIDGIWIEGHHGTPPTVGEIEQSGWNRYLSRE